MGCGEGTGKGAGEGCESVKVGGGGKWRFL